MCKFSFYLQFQCYDIFKKIYEFSRNLTLKYLCDETKRLIKSEVDHLGFWEARISSKSSETANKYVWKSRDNTKRRQTPLPEWSSDRILSFETHNRREVQRLRLSWFCRVLKIDVPTPGMAISRPRVPSVPILLFPRLAHDRCLLASCVCSFPLAVWRYVPTANKRRLGWEYIVAGCNLMWQVIEVIYRLIQPWNYER